MVQKKIKRNENSKKIDLNQTTSIITVKLNELKTPN